MSKHISGNGARSHRAGTSDRRSRSARVTCRRCCKLPPQRHAWTGPAPRQTLRPAISCCDHALAACMRTTASIQRFKVSYPTEGRSAGLSQMSPSSGRQCPRLSESVLRLETRRRFQDPPRCSNSRSQKRCRRLRETARAISRASAAIAGSEPCAGGAARRTRSSISVESPISFISHNTGDRSD